MGGRILTLAGALLLCASTADAQFGKNKVRYRDLDFRVLETAHFDLYYYPAEETTAHLIARLAERWYERLSQALDHTFDSRQPIVLYASHSHFKQTTVLPGTIPDGVGGVTDHAKGRVVLPAAPTLGETDHVLGHELVHAFQRDILRERRRSMAALPLWFLEGMAEFLSVGALDSTTAMWLSDAVAQKRLPTIAQLDRPEWFPYRYGQALWVYLAERFGPDIAARCLKSGAQGARGRLAAETKVDLATLSRDWHQALRERFGRAATSSAPDAPLIAPGTGGGRLNLGPALSPDGRWLVFLSERDRYSIDVYLADAASGRIVKRLVETAANPRLESLQFIGSAGSWSRSGSRFALASQHDGRPAVQIFDMRDGRGRLERTLPLDSLDEAYSPTWAPDESALVIAGMRGGVSNLYHLALDTQKLESLTDDAFADLQPAWSPDGRVVAFATDRYTSSLDGLRFGDLRIATYELDTGAVHEVALAHQGPVAGPQWAADGSSLYAVGEVEGRRNVLRVLPTSGEVFQVTDVPAGGVSGISAASPALSVAGRAPKMAYTVFHKGAYGVHVQALEEDGPPRPLPSQPRLVARAESSPTAALEALPTEGAAVSREREREGGTGGSTPSKDYRGRLSFERFGDPYLSAGGGFGSFLRGGISFSFGDMLGQHAWRTAVQGGRDAADFGFLSTYVNRASRWNWGVTAQQVGTVLRFTETSTRPGASLATSEVASQTERVTQIYRGVSGFGSYPFNRATRLELGAGVSWSSFGLDTSSMVHTRTGVLVSESSARSAAAQPLWLVQPTVALVHDTTAFGATGPVMGRRFRFELAPALGGVRMTQLVADWREYLTPIRPFTLAIRARHVGRFGQDAADPRLLSLIYTLRDGARGYSARGLRASGCADRSPACTFRLSQVRHLALGNVELRAPLGSLFGSKLRALAPVEAFVFSDTAGLWRGGEGGLSTPWWLSSAGAGVRINARGFVFELAAARPLTRVNGGWRLAFDFGPSF